MRPRQFYPESPWHWLTSGAIGEFLADISLYAGGNTTWMNAALATAEDGWRAEVHSLSPTDFQTEIAGYEAVNEQFPITDLRWVVAHVRFITPDYVQRLKALGGGVNLTSYEYFGTASPGGPPYRMLLDSGSPVGLSSDGMQIAPLGRRELRGGRTGAAAELAGAGRPALCVNGRRVEYPREIVDRMPTGLRLAFERSPSLIRSP